MVGLEEVEPSSPGIQ
jgi:hypothetical protein